MKSKWEFTIMFWNIKLIMSWRNFVPSDIGIQQDKILLLCLLRPKNSRCYGLRRKCTLPRSCLCGKTTFKFPLKSWKLCEYLSNSPKLQNGFLFLGYQADVVPESRRASVFGVLSGIASSAFVCGNLSTRFLSTASTFQVRDTHFIWDVLRT